MSEVRNRKVSSKRKKLKMFLLTSKKCWLMDEKLMPLYQHLVDGYSDKLREEWEVKVEESDIEAIQQVKQEPRDDFLAEITDQNLVEYPLLQVNGSTNQVIP